MTSSFGLWSLATASLIRRVPGHDDAVTAAQFSPDGSVLATGSADSTILLWDLDHPSLAGPRSP
jgi:WD40 repeat protein